MTTSRREEGISESIGFVLILAAVIFALSIYLLYMMPAMGRENEIAQMSLVKDSFTEYKVNIDTLWTSRQCTSEFGPAITLGSGETGGILGFFPFLRPVKAGAVLALNQRPENITISSDSYFLVGSGGYTETRAITTSPGTNLNINITPEHLFVNISTTDLFLQRGVLIDGPGWDVWVNVSPNYGYTRRFNLTIDPATGGLGGFWYRDEYLWNSSDITVSTYFADTPVVNNLAVYRGIGASTPLTLYAVDLMSPVYGISSQFQNPQSLWISKSDNTVSGTYLISYGYSPSVSSTTLPLGSIEYRSNNIYYTPQTYYYQLGGVFLEQDDGSTMEIPPSISLSMVNTSPVVRIGKILLQGSVADADVSGSGPITITSAVTDIKNTPLPAGNNTRWINLTIQASTANASAMWLRTLRDIADRGGLPVTSYTNGSTGNIAFINITGNPQVYDVQLALTSVNVSADYVEEYTSGGISRSWRNVPGYAAPTPIPGGLNATTTTLGASTNTPNYGDSVTFTATVTGSGGPGTPTGTVTFYNGSIVLGTSALSSGVATLAYSALPVGTHTITAVYGGDSYYYTSTSSGIVITVSSYTPPAGYTPWKDCAWTHRKNITIDKTKVVGSLSSFPVLINFTSDSDLKAYARSNGFDILFTDSTGTQKIPHQIEYYSAGTGGLIAWVKLASLSSAANTSIFMYYGNSASPNQEDKTNVWDANYKAVWHLNESGSGVSGEYKDSTSNGNNGWGGWGAVGSPPLRASGKIGYGQDFTSATNQFIGITESGGSLQINGPLTIEAWMKGDTWTDPGGNYRSVIGRQYGSGSGDSYQTAVFADGSNPSTAFTFLNTGSVFTASGVAEGSWYFLATNFTGVGGGGGTAYIHLNGGHQGNWAGLSTSIDNNPVVIGGQENDGSSQPTQLFDGMIDEVRISNVARSDNWFATEYNNQNSPTSFAYRMPQESGSCAPAFVQAAGSTAIAGNTATITLPGTSTAGNLIVVSFTNYWNNALTVSSVTDSKGNTYSLAIGPTDWNPTQNSRAWTYYAPNINGGGSPITITITFASNPTTIDTYAAEYSGIATSSPVDQTSAQTGSGVVMNSGSKTTTQASELIYGFGLSKAACTVDNPPYTARNTMNANFIADRTVSSTGSYQVTGTLASNDWMCQMVTFKGK